MFKYLAIIVCLSSTAALAQTTVAGDWLLTRDVYGNPFQQKLTLKVDGSAVSRLSPQASPPCFTSSPIMPIGTGLKKL